jgi:hypothetical protein
VIVRWSGFDADHLVLCVAVRALERGRVRHGGAISEKRVPSRIGPSCQNQGSVFAIGGTGIIHGQPNNMARAIMVFNKSPSTSTFVSLSALMEDGTPIGEVPAIDFAS